MNFLLNNKLLIILSFFFLLVSFGINANNQSDNSYIQGRNLSLAGASVFYSGIGLELVSFSFLIPGIANVNRPLMITGFSLFLTGFLSELFVGPIISIFASNRLRDLDVIDDRLILNSGFLYGMGWIAQTAALGGIIIAFAGFLYWKPAIIITGLIFTGLGVLSAIAFRTTAVTIPLLQYKF